MTGHAPTDCRFSATAGGMGQGGPPRERRLGRRRPQLIFGDMCQATMTEARAFAIVNPLSTACLRRHVKDDVTMAPYLSGAYVSAVFTEVAWLLEP